MAAFASSLALMTPAQAQGYATAQSQVYYDLPYIYTYYSVVTPLTAGTSYSHLTIPLEANTDFFLRRIMGLDRIAGTIQWYDANRSRKSSAPLHMPPDYVVAPELRYPPSAQIMFDLGVVLAPTGSTVLGFQGVRRFYGKTPPDSSYVYYSRPYTMVYTTQVDWIAGTQPRRVTFLIPEYDFELCQISLEIQKNTDTVPVISAGNVSLLLYDVNGQAMANLPVPDMYLSSNATGYNSVFPCPPIVYPANSELKVDILSLLTAPQSPATLYLTLTGKRRYPAS